ncbi:DUF397 domain-containing protein [Streptomyces sp. NPDC003247]|uniref:DUF397 domain-containing protein n=1 Tax=Streptomyces sp. NPDC003247 TaxID=3364677 RepID=UPI0036853030
MSMAKPGDDERPQWFRSSHSNGAGGECVECAVTDVRALVRDSKDPRGPVISIGYAAWLTFMDAVRQDTGG